MKSVAIFSDEAELLFIQHLNKRSRCGFAYKFAEQFSKGAFAFFSFQVRLESMEFSDFTNLYSDDTLQQLKEKYKKDNGAAFSDAEDAEKKANKFASMEIAKKLANHGLFVENGNIRCLTCKIISCEISRGLKKNHSVAEIHVGSQPDCKLIKHMYTPALVKNAVDSWKKLGRAGCHHGSEPLPGLLSALLGGGIAPSFRMMRGRSFPPESLSESADERDEPE